MTTSAAITIPYAPADTDFNAGDFLKIVQEPWPEPTAKNFVEWLNSELRDVNVSNIMTLYAEYISECSALDGSFDAIIYVQKSAMELEYSINATHGELSAPAIVTQEHSDSFSLGDFVEYLDVGMRIDTLVSAKWEDVVYSANGTIVRAPVISLQNGVLVWTGKAFGTIRVAWKSDVERYLLTVPPRKTSLVNHDTGEIDLEAVYRSTIRAIWSGRITHLDIDLPDMTGNCSGGATACANCTDEESGDEPYEKCYRRIIEVDACNPTEILSDILEEMACPDSE